MSPGRAARAARCRAAALASHLLLGIDQGGVKVPQVGVPIATLTGWNLRRAPYVDGDLCELNGMYLPLAETRDQARAAGDPRPSLQELYKSHKGYVKAVERFVKKSVRERFLLSFDAEAAIEDAENSNVLQGVKDPPGHDDDQDGDDDSGNRD